MTIQQLKYIVAIADAGSLNKASEVLYVTQPSLTAAVHDLEAELGIRVFFRTARGVTLTPDGEEFIPYARQLVQQYDAVLDRYAPGGGQKKKFGISTQHYSFVVKSFVEMAKRYDMAAYEFAVRETKTRDVIEDVRLGRSELGILYLSDFNRSALEKLLRAADLSFTRLIGCEAYVYLWAGHPLADRPSLTFEDLAPYPCLAFEQETSGSFYYAEEILSTADYPRLIRANDRATMLNLMVGLNGYTLCSGIICAELNGPDYRAVPFDAGGEAGSSRMEIGYLARKNTLLSPLAEEFLAELRQYLAAEAP